MTQSKEHTPLPWRNYKHWVFDAKNDHVFNPDADYLSENDAKTIVEVVNKQNERLVRENAKMREALEKLTLLPKYPTDRLDAERIMQIAKEALESPLDKQGEQGEGEKS